MCISVICFIIIFDTEFGETSDGEYLCTWANIAFKVVNKNF